MLRRSVFCLVSFVLLASVVIPPASVSAQEAVSPGQKQALMTKPAVVRIYDGYAGTWVIPSDNISVPTQLVGSGSGSIIHPDGYILTNAHVTDLTKQGQEKGQDLLFDQFIRKLAAANNRRPEELYNNYNVMQYIRANARIRDFVHVHHVVLPNGEAMPFEIKEFGAPVGQGKDVAIVKIEIKNAPTLRLGNSDTLQLQDHVTVFGYPAAADTFDSGLLDRKSALEASITDGKLSAKKNSADGAPILQISAPATHGNSGGPVLNDAGDVIGLLTFRGDTVNGQEVSGFAFVVPTSTAMEFVKKAGTTNEPGMTDTRYREGLELYWNGYYTAAIQKFEEVKRLFPQHSEVDRLITDSQQKIAEGKENKSVWIYVVIGAIVIFFLIVVFAILAFLLLRRGKRKPALQPGYQGAGGYPQMGPGYQPSQPPAPVAPIGQSFGGTADKTVALQAHPAAGNVAPHAGFGRLACTSGPLTGQSFQIPPEGLYIGRDATLSQIVVNDNRVSKRHLWIGPRNDRITVVDQGSTNGTFLNTPSSQRVSEVMLNPGDTIVLSEADVARFRFERF